ncbi:Clp protease N-terminal domain-containing protein [Prauserella aidingensis]|uniref:Clp protease N-terminal domain-containing protein n=1 Tax=Prauserella aidingensis TaxID=387890 RepID=UPI0020A3EE87|nr:Clp protease N-terminal domain-containing protein [Prauserella aidingensis]
MTMFERFTKDARALVATATEHAESGDADRVDALHLLTAIVDPGPADTATPALDLLAAVDVAPADIVGRVAELRRHGGLSDVDRRVLRDLGIDVDTVVAHVENQHGEGVLAEGTTVSPEGGTRRRRTRWHTPFGSDAKRVLEASLEQARDIRDDRVGSEHVLPALATVAGPAADVLADAGASPE